MLFHGSTPLRCPQFLLHFCDIPIYCDISSGIVRPYIPQTLRKTAFDTIHNHSHLNGKTTSRLLRKKFIWPGIHTDAIKWSRKCLACQRAKIHHHNKLKLNRIEIPDNRFIHVHLDIIFLPKVKEYQYCLTIIDKFTRWPVAVPIADITADTVCKTFYENWICHYGAPTKITTDQGTQFESALFQALAKSVGAEKTRTRSYHPKSNGIVKRMHRTLKAALMCSQFLEKHKEYTRVLKPTPTAHHNQARIFILKNLDTCSHVFVRCDLVKAPLEAPYIGPYKVIERTTDRVYKLDINGEEKNISIERLNPAYISKTDDNESVHAAISTPQHVQPHQRGSIIMDKPKRTYTRKVTFKSPAESHLGGVDVAVH